MQLSGTKDELLGGTSTLVRGADPAALERALRYADLTFTADADGEFNVAADPVDVGTAALRGQVVLTDLRATGADLEQLFLDLTSTHSHDNYVGGTTASDVTAKQEVAA